MPKRSHGDSLDCHPFHFGEALLKSECSSSGLSKITQLPHLQCLNWELPPTLCVSRPSKANPSKVKDGRNLLIHFCVTPEERMEQVPVYSFGLRHRKSVREAQSRQVWCFWCNRWSLKSSASPTTPTTPGKREMWGHWELSVYWCIWREA